MKGLYRYLSPFSPDQSGAVSVLFELGGIIVICDAGGCAGNICGFDEPRWQTHQSAVFSAVLRDMDAIFGRDDRLLDKIADTLESVDARFVALIGTPVPAVIGTDFRALRRLAEKRFGLPVITVDTTGMELYSVGQEKACRALFEAFPPERTNGPGPADCGSAAAGLPQTDTFAGVWGATPLDLAASDSAALLRKRLSRDGFRVVTYGMDSSLDDIKACANARMNYVVSPSGLKAAQFLKEKFDIPYTVEPPVPSVPAAVPAAGPDAVSDIPPDERSQCKGPVLIVHQQFFADGIRNLLRTAGYAGTIDCATFFSFVPDYAEAGDRFLAGEDEFISLVADRGYRTIAADPLFLRAVPGFTGMFVPLPHFAVSGQLYAVSDEQTFMAPVYRMCRSLVS